MRLPAGATRLSAAGGVFAPVPRRDWITNAGSTARGSSLSPSVGWVEPDDVQATRREAGRIAVARSSRGSRAWPDDDAAQPSTGEHERVEPVEHPARPRGSTHG
jgi:hypothetical protein